MQAFKAVLGVTVAFVAFVTFATAITGFLNSDSPSTTSYATTTTYSSPSNLDMIRIIGKSTVQTGYATEYDVGVMGSYLDFTISSLLPGDARFVAETACGVARLKGLTATGWTVRVFLPIGGDRPAATCAI